MSETGAVDACRWTNKGAIAARGSSYPVQISACIATSPRGRVRLLDAIAAGESAFVIAAANGAVSIRAQIVPTERVEIQYGMLSVDWCRGVVSSQMGCVVLSRSELRLLGALLDASAMLVSREHLLMCTWPEVDQEATRFPALERLVRSLRHRLAAIGAASRLQTLPRVGYRLTP